MQVVAAPAAAAAPGGGGSGGISVGILYKDKAPVVDAPTTSSITVGTEGGAGPGGKPGVNNGRAGTSAKLKDAAQL